jgi:hypothetical protein
MGAQVVGLSGDAWLDLIVWRSCGAFEASRAKGVNLPGIQAYAENIAGILADEQGERLDVESLNGVHLRTYSPRDRGPERPLGRPAVCAKDPAAAR